mmetsp:Transcript_25125/g.75432  ORF Transcript_25125/g.75432 Transcript_25125/m.75432 type:complete len:317 (-) Transcript_25125:23-973(-)
MATAAAAIAAWEQEGLRLLASEDRASLRASADRIAVAARAPLSRPAFERVAALTCELLEGAPASLCALSACSKSMLRVARADRLWPTARRFPETHDLGLASGGGFHDYSRMARLWGSPSDVSMSAVPSKDDYSLLLTFKVDGVRIAGGLFDLADSRIGHQIGKHFIEFNLGTMMLPGSLRADLRTGMACPTISVCIKRKRDQKCLHLLTDVRLYADGSDEDVIAFSEDDNCATRPQTSKFAPLSKSARAAYWYQDMEFSCPMFVDGDDDSPLLLVGFTEDSVARLMTWSAKTNNQMCRCIDPTDVLRQWHASRNWV